MPITSQMLNARLASTYEKDIKDLVGLATIDGASCPHLLYVPEEYPSCPTKLLFVGQQTFGWGEPARLTFSNAIAELMKEYKAFDLARNYTRSPFWQACFKLQRLINPDSPERGFLWSNLVKIDQRGNRPDEDLEEAISSFRLLQSEIAITAPTVVVFFTGPKYDERLKSSFQGITFAARTKLLAMLHHAKLPALSFRTYHPNYLRRSGNWRVLEAIAKEVYSARTAANSGHYDAHVFDK